MLAAEMEKELKVRIAITNTPGGAGAIGTQAMFDLAHDGYTWSGNADGSIVTYQAMGLVKEALKDYASFVAVFTPNVICVPANSPYKDLPALMDAMKAKPVTVASAGAGSGGHQAAEFFKKFTTLDYRHVPYQGGAPAVTATVKGEVDAIMQLSMEVAEMLRAKQLVALAVMDTVPLTVEGYGDIPPITNWVKDFPVTGNRFGLFIPAGIPADAMSAISNAFEKAAQSDAIKKFATEKGSKAICVLSPAVNASMTKKESLICWLLHEGGTIKEDPSKFGIAKP